MKCYSILLVDDDPVLLRGLERNFDEAGYEIITAVSAAEALAILRHCSVHAVICDNQMPGTTGLHFLNILRREFPNVLRFMLTGCISKFAAHRVVNEIGVCGLFRKPCEAHILSKAVREAIEQNAFHWQETASN